MKSKESEDEEKLTEKDRIILTELKNAPNGLHNCELKKKIKNESTLSKRLKKLEAAHLVKRHIIKKRPVEIIYILVDDAPSEKDLYLIYDALDAFSYLRNINYITSRLEAKSWKKEEKVLKESYSRLYPYYLWCLSYSSRAESDVTRRTLVRFYAYTLRKHIHDLLKRVKNRQIFREFIDLAGKYADEEELLNQLNTAKEFFCFEFSI